MKLEHLETEVIDGIGFQATHKFFNLTLKRVDLDTLEKNKENVLFNMKMKVENWESTLKPDKLALLDNPHPPRPTVEHKDGKVFKHCPWCGSWDRHLSYTKEQDEWVCRVCDGKMYMGEKVANDQEDEDTFLWDALKVPLGGYNSEVNNDILKVMCLIQLGKFNTDISQETGMTKAHVELIQYILCSADLADYGTSPRGCWLTKEGKELLKRITKARKL